ncbi:hypothetical protein HZC07_04325, partial [Candidatus Micrarchaeota archaeon]|nr:hypothetical protein [Candidatus Micrarchaeota archaeon]
MNRIRKEVSDCGILGAIAIKGGRGFVTAKSMRDGIEIIRPERGGEKTGNGIYLSHPNNHRSNGRYRVEVLATDSEALQNAERILDEEGGIGRNGEWHSLTRYNEDKTTAEIW